MRRARACRVARPPRVTSTAALISGDASSRIKTRFPRKDTEHRRRTQVTPAVADPIDRRQRRMQARRSRADPPSPVPHADRLRSAGAFDRRSRQARASRDDASDPRARDDFAAARLATIDRRRSRTCSGRRSDRRTAFTARASLVMAALAHGGRFYGWDGEGYNAEGFGVGGGAVYKSRNCERARRTPASRERRDAPVVAFHGELARCSSSASVGRSRTGGSGLRDNAADRMLSRVHHFCSM